MVKQGWLLPVSVDGGDTSQGSKNNPNIIPNGLDFILLFGKGFNVLNREILLLDVLQI